MQLRIGSHFVLMNCAVKQFLRFNLSAFSYANYRLVSTHQPRTLLAWSPFLLYLFILPRFLHSCGRALTLLLNPELIVVSS